jgi:hypothetical protein
MFTVTVGRKPSEASYFYDTPDDVVELLASLAKTTSIDMERPSSFSSSQKTQRSASLSDLDRLMYQSERPAFLWDAETSMQKKTSVAERRENDRAGLRRETQQARREGRLKESTSLTNLAKLVEGGEVLNEETVASAQAGGSLSVSAAYQTMEQYMDFEEEEEAPDF